MSELEKHYSPGEVAQLLGVTERTVWNYIALGTSTRGKSGIYPVVKLSHKVTRIPTRAVNRYLKSCTVTVDVPETVEAAG